MCKDGSVSGKSSMLPLNSAAQSECNDGTNNVKYGPLDSAFRSAVSVARFQLIKKMQETTADYCKNTANWDAMRCINSLMPKHTSSGSPASRVDDMWSAQCYFVDILAFSGGPSSCSGNVGKCLSFPSDGIHPSKGFGYGNSGATVLDGCSEPGNPKNGMCTIRVCAPTLQINLRSSPFGSGSIKLRWTHEGTTYTREIIDPVKQCESGWLEEWEWDGSNSGGTTVTDKTCTGHCESRVC